ncbi:MAG: hypothetical protein FWE24_07410 [Defluviitaleaceae bacterium]|nr:hypothetical protein [Defluviitaleaceae bacterium]
MKEINFRYTNHDSYSLARSFFTMGGMIIFASVIEFILFNLPVDWTALGTLGIVIRGIGIGIGVFLGIYLGFKLSCRVFDKHGSIILNDNEIILKTSKGNQQAAIENILEIKKEIFAKFDGLRFKDTKTFGPLFTKHSIITAEKEIFVMSSIAEGWEKAGKEVFGRENPVPIYSIDEAFKEVDAYVKKVKQESKETQEE